MDEEELLKIGTRVQKIGDHCAADFLSKGEIIEVVLDDQSGYVHGGVTYTVKYDSGHIRPHLIRSTLRLESDPPYKGPYGYTDAVILPTDFPFESTEPVNLLKLFTTKQLVEELNKRDDRVIEQYDAHDKNKFTNYTTYGEIDDIGKL